MPLDYGFILDTHIGIFQSKIYHWPKSLDFYYGSWLMISKSALCFRIIIQKWFPILYHHIIKGLLIGCALLFPQPSSRISTDYRNCNKTALCGWFVLKYETVDPFMSIPFWNVRELPSNMLSSYLSYILLWQKPWKCFTL